MRICGSVAFHSRVCGIDWTSVTRPVPNARNREPIIRYLKVLLLGLLWAIAFILLHRLAPVFGASTVAFWRTLIGACILFVMGRGWRSAGELRPHAASLTLLGMANVAAPFFLFSYASIFLPASHLSALNGLTPVFAILFCAMLYGEPIKLRQVFAICMLLSGLYSLADFHGASVKSANAGWASAVLGAMSYATAITMSRRFQGKLSSLAQACGSLVAASVLLAPFYAINQSPYAGNDLLVDLLLLLLLGAACTAGAALLLFHVISQEGPVFASMASALVGPLAAFIELGLDSEQPIAFGVFLVALAVLLVSKPARQSPWRGEPPQIQRTEN
ncbi:DMT family transporter [Paucibacter sp. APW11]|uniref:DMT family transporter n=1 Tax=Roseateles aquae TaxID=3077235 RepID=A0ABU3PCU5_9BURK|nr:DMT family transporter [Paucibacter sp. APW11]MDT8999686.1 DMT family transporter [Paucibacter sp. APW11]